MDQNKIEVCFSPALFPFFKDSEAIVVVVDILRASSAICNAFHNGVQKIIPVGTVQEAKDYKEKGFMVAAERDGYVKDFADFGNSPFNFTPERVGGKQIVYSTTNGTMAIHMAAGCYRVVIGAYLNCTAICEWITRQKRNLIILCAGWKNKFNLEDSVFAGFMVRKLLATGLFHTICDSATAAMDLYSLAEGNMLQYIDKAAQRERLRQKNLDDVIPYCHTRDVTDKIPVFRENALVVLEK